MMQEAERETLAPAVALFRGLADPVRLSILRRLAHDEARVVDLMRELGLAQSTVSAHVACLRDCGLVDYRAEGRQSFHALTRPELTELLAAAELVAGSIALVGFGFDSWIEAAAAAVVFHRLRPEIRHG